MSPIVVTSSESSLAVRSPLAGVWLWARFIVFAAMHVAALVLPFVTTGIHANWLALCAASYALRMFGISAGYHRYFSHRTFRTSRAFQFVLAWWAQSANQNGVLWWAARHRHHHRYSDTPEDVHSPSHYGFVTSHLTWFMHPENWAVDESMVKDWMKYPELVFLQRVPFLPTVFFASLMLLCFGWGGVLWGYFVPTVLLLHTTFATNSINHMFGDRPYDTPDNSRNNALLGLLTFGEGWHNNHHHAPHAARIGWRWYEIDVTWGGLWLFQRLGLIWDVKGPPAGSG